MELTDRQFWLDYWEKKDNLIIEVSEKLPLIDIFKQINQTKKLNSSIEIGGFPGHYSIYLKKKFGFEVSLLDYVIHEGIIKKLQLQNRLKTDDIEIIEGNIFEFETKKRYDLVFSNGLIEHFDDTELIIKKHVELLSDSGTLFISLPNFRGFNGWLQKNFDKENYAIHNISSMDIKRLTDICKKLNLKNIEVKYNGVFLIWLENIKTKPLVFKWMFKITWLFFKIFFKIIPIESKTFSPYIVILAEK